VSSRITGRGAALFCKGNLRIAVLYNRRRRAPFKRNFQLSRFKIGRIMNFEDQFLKLNAKITASNVTREPHVCSYVFLDRPPMSVNTCRAAPLSTFSFYMAFFPGALAIM
jgi:hypothetical protein